MPLHSTHRGSLRDTKHFFRGQDRALELLKLGELHYFKSSHHAVSHAAFAAGSRFHIMKTATESLDKVVGRAFGPSLSAPA
jgi:hypothetical protein